MSDLDSTVLSPSLHDQFNDAAGGRFGLPDEQPVQDADAFPDDRLSDEELDALWVAEQERRDRESAAPAGYSEAVCMACETALFVPAGEGSDVLCPACTRLGDLLSDEADAAEPAVIMIRSASAFTTAVRTAGGTMIRCGRFIREEDAWAAADRVAEAVKAGAA